MNRYLHATFCDDIRREEGNKVSLMGIYGNYMYFPEFPAKLQKLCIAFSANTLADNPFESLSFVLMKNDEEIVRQDVPKEHLDQLSNAPDVTPPNVNGQSMMTIQAFVILPEFVVEEPCLLRVRAITERETLKAPGLLIDRSQAQNTK